MTNGSKVSAKITASDSFYRAVEGTVVSIRNGFVEICATRVMSKWDRKMEDHPTFCTLSVKIENVKVLS